MLIHERFFERARLQPEAEAIAFHGDSLTYGACAALAERLAGGLAEYLRPGSRVAINTFKSAETIVLMLACLRAGLTYVPVDPASPVRRRCAIVRDSEAQCLVVDERTAKDWSAEPELLVSMRLLVGPQQAYSGAPHTTTLQALAAPRPNPPADRGARPVGEDDLAYILYTSGSTGEPKGVMISHRNAAAFVGWACEYFDLRPGDRVAVHAPLHFDLPVFDVYVGLARGATVCPIDEKTSLFPQGLLRFLHEQRISVLYAVPSALTALVKRSTIASDVPAALRLLLYAGEEFHPAPLRTLMDILGHVRVFNLYGPIETNVVTALEVRREHLDHPRIPIGLPINNTRVMLLDDVGGIIDGPDQEGEIVVSGPSVSPGYLNRPDLTAERFVPNPFASGRLEIGDWRFGGVDSPISNLQSPISEQLYRTGDYARWDAAGVLHFLGRRDALIKTRGFRVELGDVEATLLAHPAVAEAAVVAMAHPEYTNLLYAFVVPSLGSALEEHQLLTWCKARLPGYMVPHKVELRDSLPKTSTGKIARRQLVAP